MLSLSIECSGNAGSIAVMDCSAPVVHKQLASTPGSVRSLAPAVQLLLQDYPKLQFLSVTIGPGSFTGLRVGLATVKMLSLALNIPVAAVDTLEAIALRARLNSAELLLPGKAIIPIINAYRKQVFTGVWHPCEDGVTRAATSQVIDAETWCDDPCRACDARMPPESAFVTGPGLLNYPPRPQSHLTVVPEDLWQPRAVEVGMLGYESFLRGELLSAETLAPNYIRDSAAVEKLKTS